MNDIEMLDNIENARYRTLDFIPLLFSLTSQSDLSILSI